MVSVDVPSHHDGREAYVPATPGDEGEDDWPPPSREIAIEKARKWRLEKGGVPVDRATLGRVADAVMDPRYRRPGAYYTADECEDEVPEDRCWAVDEYLRRHPEIDGGTRLAWLDGRHTLFIGLVGDARVHEAELRRIGGERVAFESAPRTVSELDAIADRILADEPALRGAGFAVFATWIEPQRGVVEVELVGGRDAAAAVQYFTGRYGDAVAVEWLGPSPFCEVPHPFGSWTSDGRLIRVFFGLDLNGQRRGSARVTEENGERIVITLTCLQPVGPTTMIGGFQRQRADLELREPVGDRAVIDASAGVARPSLAQLHHR
jgi:hypothetical protein